MGNLGSVVWVTLLTLFAACKVDRDRARETGEGHASSPAAGRVVGTARAARGLLESLSGESRQCLDCHQKETPAVVEQWGSSRHYRGKVGCYECHQARPNESDAFLHHGKHIATIVSPKDCGSCHSAEHAEFSGSHHAQAGRIVGSLDNVLAEVVEGTKLLKTEGFPDGVSAAVVNSCWQCHGSEVKVPEEGKLDPATWPNTGMGRLNPDGSRGSCTACHSRHRFSVAQARGPETCGKCHMGPDHPQMEIYNESKHGVAFRENLSSMNLENEKWVVGQDYSAAPTCATCHMSATPGQPVTHDVGLRISWNNRPARSIRPEVSDEKLGLPGARIGWEKRRKNMEDVCLACHGQPYVDAFYVQYDALIDEYHQKFAEPGAALVELAAPLLKPDKFSNKLDFIWFELWHRAGRRARHAASMQGPNHAHAHGTYEVAKHFYTELVPELEALIARGKADADPAKVDAATQLEAKLDEVLNGESHRWVLGKMSDEEKKERAAHAKEFGDRYAE